MNPLTRVSFIATHKTFRNIIIIRGFVTAAAGNLESEKAVEEMDWRGNCVTYYTLITDELSRAVELLDEMRRVKKGLSPNNYTSLIDSLCKQDKIDEAYRVLIQMIVSGFSPSVITWNHVVCGFLRIGEMMNYNTLITEMCKAEELSHAVQLLDHMRRVKKGLTPNKITFTSLIDSLCKQDRIDEASKVLNEMIVSGFSPSFATLNDVLRGFLRIRETAKAYELHYKIDQHFSKEPIDILWRDYDTYSSLKQGFSDGVAYTSLMNSYLDDGKLFHVDKLLYRSFDWYPYSVRISVFINGLDNKARTTNTKKYILRENYDSSLLDNPTLEYRRTLAVNYSDDEFKSLVELVKGFCNRGDTMLKWNYKPNGIVYNLFIIEHCKCDNAVQAYNMYKEMGHYSFSCHMFTVFALIQTLKKEAMFNELRWVVQNVLRSCNLNDSEIHKFLNEFNPNKPNCEALFNVLAEKAKDGPFLNIVFGIEESGRKESKGRERWWKVNLSTIWNNLKK